MPTSPDITPYVDLTLYDKDAQELVDQALDDAAIKLPDWDPREGNTEVVLIEALSLTVQELIFATNRLPGAVTEVLLKLYGLDRDPGTPPTGSVTFTLANTLGHTIAAGTTLRLDLGPDVDPLDLTTDVGLAVPAGSSVGTVAVTGTENTIRANGIAIGTVLELIDAAAHVETVTIATTLAGGTEPEDAEAFLDRGATLLARLVNTLVLPDHFVAAALLNPAVYRAFGLDNYTPANDPDNNGPVGNDPGHVTVAVAGLGGLPVPAATKTAIDAELEAQAMANLAVHLIDPTITSVAVTVTVKGKAGYTATQVQANVSAALTAYLNPDTWPWAAVVRRNELISVIDDAAGVDYVSTLTAPAADVTLAGVAPLANAGTISVTVT